MEKVNIKVCKADINSFNRLSQVLRKELKNKNELQRKINKLAEMFALKNQVA